MSRKTGRSDSPLADFVWPPSEDVCTAPPTTPASNVQSPHHGDNRRRKTRRLEFTTLDTIQQEVSMYLDSLANQGDGLIDTAAVDAALHEALRVLCTCWVHGGSRLEAFESVRALSPITTNLLLTFGHHHVTADSQHVVLRGGPEELARVGALIAVLRSITLSRARAAALLGRQQQQQQRHHHQPHSADGGGGGDGPSGQRFPGLSLSSSSSSPFFSYNVPHSGSAPSVASTQPYTSSLALAQESSLESLSPGSPTLPQNPRKSSSISLAKPVSRLVLLNCHAFGWLDSLGHDDYEQSARTLQQVSAGLDAVVMDPAYAALGRPPTASEGRQRMGREAVTVVPAMTTVLLSDAILMEGGVPSLALHANSTVLMAHHQYGRGLACLVPSLPPPPPPSSSPAWQPITDSRGYFVSTPPPPPSLRPHYAGRAASNEESPNNSQLATPGDLNMPGDAEGAEEEAYMDKRYHRAMASTTPPQRFLSGESGHTPPAATLYAATDLYTLRPVSCGARTLLGMQSQAVLVAPAGPLILHVEFNPRTTAAQTPSRQDAGVVGAVDGNTTTAATVEEAVLNSCRRLSCSTTSACGSSAREGPVANGHSDPVSSLAAAGLAANADGGLTAAAQSKEAVEWMLQLLRCPQSAILVEWHLDGAERTTGAATAAATAASSAVLRLLESYAEMLDEEALRVAEDDTAASHWDPAFCGSGGDRRRLLELVHDTAARFTRWPAPVMPQPDGRVRPFLFARGLELASESERMVSENAIVTTLQYRSI